MANSEYFFYSDTYHGGNGRYCAALNEAIDRTNPGVDKIFWAPMMSPDWEPIDGFSPVFGDEPPSGLWGRSPQLVQRMWILRRQLKFQPYGRKFILCFSTHLEAFLVWTFVRNRFEVRIAIAHDVVPHRWYLPKLIRPIERWLAKLAWSIWDMVIVHDERAALKLGGAKVYYHMLPALGRSSRATRWEDRAGIVLLGAMRPDKDYCSVVRAYQALTPDVRSRHRLQIVGRPMRGFDIARLLREIERDSDGILLEPRFCKRSEFESALLSARATVLPYLSPESGSAVAAEAELFGCQLIVPEAGELALYVANGAYLWPEDEDGRVAVLIDALTSGKERDSSAGSLAPTFDDFWQDFVCRLEILTHDGHG